jgi:hypothetical protein
MASTWFRLRERLAKQVDWSTRARESHDVEMQTVDRCRPWTGSVELAWRARSARLGVRRFALSRVKVSTSVPLILRCRHGQ